MVNDLDTSAPLILDPICAQAQELARAAAVEVARDAVGAYLGAHAESEFVVTHTFASTQSGSLGWNWAVTVARTSDVVDPAHVTVDEVVLLPGDGALLAPAW